MELKFSCLYNSSGGVLSPEQLRFFYYDVCFDFIQGNPNLYEWDDKIEAYIDSHHIIVDSCNKSSLSKTFETDKMLFEMKNETKPMAFFRHLRNAFAHFNINYQGDYLIMMDKDSDKTTMVGKIKFEDLKELCYLFFNQREAMYINEDNRTI